MAWENMKIKLSGLLKFYVIIPREECQALLIMKNPHEATLKIIWHYVTNESSRNEPMCNLMFFSIGMPYYQEGYFMISQEVKKCSSQTLELERESLGLWLSF
jgi:hypothetical protein